MATVRSTSGFGDRSLAVDGHHVSQKKVIKETIAERQRRIQMLLTGKADAHATENQTFLEHEETTETDMTDMGLSMNSINESLKEVVVAEPEPVVVEEPEPIVEPEPEPLPEPPVSPKREVSVDVKEALEFAEECAIETSREESALPRAQNTLKDVPLEQRHSKRELNLHQAFDRVEDVKTQEMMEEERRKLLEKQEERRQLAYTKYMNHGMPNKKRLLELIAKEPELDEEDVERLPWLPGNLVVDLAKMR